MMFGCLSGNAVYDPKIEIKNLPVCFCLPRMQVLAECHKHYSCLQSYSIFSSKESYYITLHAKDKVFIRNPQPESKNVSKQGSWVMTWEKYMVLDKRFSIEWCALVLFLKYFIALHFQRTIFQTLFWLFHVENQLDKFYSIFSKRSKNSLLLNIVRKTLWLAL